MLFSDNQKLFASVEKVPDALIRTPLQRVVQILKRHRDVRFSDHSQEKYKPISMIITTLCAHLYESEADIATALKNIVAKLAQHASLLKHAGLSEEQKAALPFIKRTEKGEWIIENPVNSKENFADRWHEEGNVRAAAFFKWVSWVQRDLLDIIDQFDLEQSAPILQESFGPAMTNRALKALAPAAIPSVAATTVSPNRGPQVEISRPSKPWGKHNG